MVTVAQLDILLRAPLSALDKDFDKALAKTRQLGSNLNQVGRSLTVGLTLPLAAVGAGAVKAAIGFEQALTNISKTVDATEPEIRALGERFRELSIAIPLSTNELANLGATAGQLGIATANLADFVETAAALGVSTNLSAEAAAVAIARLSNIMGTAQTDADRYGAAIVDLGNNLATTEAEIVEMALRLAGAGRQIGLTEGEVLGFAGALSSLGVRAEAGGTSLSRTFVEIANAVRGATPALQEFSQIAGLSTQEFSQIFNQDAARAVTVFVQGLKRIGDEGGNVFAALERVALADIRVRDALLRAAGGADLLVEALQRGNRSWFENTALTEEAAKFYATVGARLKTLRNEIVNLAAELGEGLFPAVESTVNVFKVFLRSLQPIVQVFADLPRPVQQLAVALTALVAAIGPLTLITGQLVLAYTALIPILRSVAVAAGVVSVSFGVLAAVTGGILAIGLVAYLASVAVAERDAANATNELSATLKVLAGRIGELQEAELNRLVANLEGSLATLKAEFSTLSAEVASQLSGVSGLVARFGAGLPAVPILGGFFSSFTAGFAASRQELKGVGEQVAALESVITDAKGRLDELATGVTVPPITPDAAGVDTATEKLRGMVEILREAGREVGLLDERARAFGPAFDVARERVAILEGALDDLFRLDQTPEVLAAIDSIAAQLAQAQLAVEAFELPPLTLNIEVPDFALDFRDIGREAATTFVSSFSRGIGSLTDKLLSVFGRIFDRIAGDFIAKLIQGIGAAGGGPLAAIPLVSTLASLNPFGSVAPSATAVSPAAQFTTIPKESLSPLTIHALARDPVVQSLSREIALVAQEDGF